MIRSGRIGSFVLILWTWGGLYTAFFSWQVLGLPTYLVLFSGATIFLMGPLIWLVDMVVLKRILLRTIRRYMSAIPDSTQAGLSFYRFSTLP